MDDQPVLDITFTCDYETYQKLLSYKMRIKLFVMIPILLAGILIELIYDPAIVNIILYPIMLVPIWTMSVTWPARYYKAKDMLQTTQRLIFYENYLNNETIGLMTSQNSTHRYELFNRVRETKYTFYIYFQDDTCYAVAKKYLYEQQVVILHDFLMRRFGKRYKYTRFPVLA